MTHKSPDAFRQASIPYELEQGSARNGDPGPDKTDRDEQVFEGHQHTENLRNSLLAVSGCSLLRLGLHVQFRATLRRNTETMPGKASLPSAGRRRRTNCRHIFPPPDHLLLIAGKGAAENNIRKPLLASGMSWTRKSLISGTPLTNGSCTKPALASSNTQAPSSSTQYGAIIMIWFGIFNSLLLFLPYGITRYPVINYIEYQQNSNDDPPRLAGRMRSRLWRCSRRNTGSEATPHESGVGNTDKGTLVPRRHPSHLHPRFGPFNARSFSTCGFTPERRRPVHLV